MEERAREGVSLVRAGEGQGGGEGRGAFVWGWGGVAAWALVDQVRRRGDQMKAIRSRSNDRVIVAPGTNSCVLFSLLIRVDVWREVAGVGWGVGVGGGNVCQGFG